MTPDVAAKLIERISTLTAKLADIEADRSVGRRHYPIVSGRKASSYIYAAFMLGAYLSLVIGVALDQLPLTSLLGLLTLVIAVPTLRGVVLHAEDLEQLMPPLGLNVILTVTLPILTGTGLLIAA